MSRADGVPVPGISDFVPRNNDETRDTIIPAWAYPIDTTLALPTLAIGIPITLNQPLWKRSPLRVGLGVRPVYGVSIWTGIRYDSVVDNLFVFSFNLRYLRFIVSRPISGEKLISSMKVGIRSDAAVFLLGGSFITKIRGTEYIGRGLMAGGEVLINPSGPWAANVGIELGRTVNQYSAAIRYGLGTEGFSTSLTLQLQRSWDRKHPVASSYPPDSTDPDSHAELISMSNTAVPQPVTTSPGCFEPPLGRKVSTGCALVRGLATGILLGAVTTVAIHTVDEMTHSVYIDQRPATTLGQSMAGGIALAIPVFLIFNAIDD